jgi:hypothetical protein
MVMLPVWRSTIAIIQVMNTKMDEAENNLSDRASILSSEPRPAMPSLFGESLLMTVSTSARASAKRGSIAPSSEMKAAVCARPTLYGRQWRSLLTAGLIAGITPMSIRKRCGADCREAVLFPLAGDMSDGAGIEHEPEAVN